MRYETVNTKRANLLILGPLVRPSLARRFPSVIASGIRVIHPVKLGAPYLNDLHEPPEKYLFDPLVQFRDPLIKIGVTLQVQPIDLLAGSA